MISCWAMEDSECFDSVVGGFPLQLTAVAAGLIKEKIVGRVIKLLIGPISSVAFIVNEIPEALGTLDCTACGIKKI